MESPDPIIHIGYHKTGTGWFQRRFYPAVTNACYIPRATVRKALLEPTALHFEPESARRTLGLDAEGCGQSVILCEEELSGNIHLGGLRGCLTKDVAYRLKRTLPNARIVLLLRNQYAALASSYVQYVKEGGTHSPHHYFFPEDRYRRAHYALQKGPHFTFAHFDYHTLIRHYEKVFGRDRIYVFLFEDFLKEAGFTQSFVKELGLQVDLHRIPTDDVNPGYPAALLPLARGLNHFTWRNVPDKHYFISIPAFHRFRILVLRGITRLTRPLDLPKFGVSPEVKVAAARWYAEGNRRLMEERGLELAWYGYPLDEGEP